MNIEFLKNREALHQEDVVVVPLFEEYIEKGFTPYLKMLTRSKKGSIKKVVSVREFTGKKDSTIQFDYEDKDGMIKTIVLYGLGKQDDFDYTLLQCRAAEITQNLIKLPFKSLALNLPWGNKVDDLKTAVKKLFLGISLVTYRFNRYKTEAPKENVSEIKLFVDGLQELLGDKTYKKYIKELATCADTVYHVRDLVNDPPNVLTPEVFKDTILNRLKKRKGVTVNVFDYDMIKKMGFNLIEAVGRASNEKPYLVEIKYKSSKKNVPTLALVGKGVTYDAGGYSLKPGPFLENMHIDMHGAGTMYGVMDLITHHKLDFNVNCYLILAENLISGDAYKVMDVIKSYSGKTVEIFNTDAEGRLLLADAIAFAGERGAQVIIETATLTGAIITALGNHIAGMMTESDALASSFKTAADEVEEKYWRMPLDPTYKERLKSDVADLRNIGSAHIADSIVAGLFLNEFKKKDVKFMHLDMAGTGILKEPYSFYTRGGSGFGVQAISHYILKGDIPFN